MKRSVFVTLAAAALAGPAAAQTAAIDAEVKRKLDATRYTERTEDVEVLRRILNTALGLPNQAAVNPVTITNNGRGVTTADGVFHPGYDGFMTVPAAVGPFDGVYLPGHGVVYTLKVPASAGVALDTAMHTFGLLETCLKCHRSVQGDTVKPAPAVKPPTEWERTRVDLLGQKPPAPAPVKPSPICEPGSMTEALVAKLRANARNVRHLAAIEHVTIVVTFDGYTGVVANRRTRDPAATVSNPDNLIGFTPKQRQQLELGDLHMKQDRPREAAAAYEQGLVNYRNPVYRMVAPTYRDDEWRARVAAAGEEIRLKIRHLARAWLAAGEPDKAQAALDLARKFTIETVPEDEVFNRGAARIKVPAKLILGVSKADVDKAGDDEAAFKKAVTVEVVGFPAADKPAAPVKAK